MASNVVAYVGIDNFDHILYISRILSKAGKKVLIIDHTDSLLLKHSIPQPQGICCDRNIISYRDVDFTTLTINPELMNQYDDILISYGFNDNYLDIVLCSRIVCVTDLLRYNQEKIAAIISSNIFLKHSSIDVLIKDYFEIKVTPDLLVDQMNMNARVGNITLLYRDDRDYMNLLVCHFNRIFQFSNISKQLKQYLISEIISLHPEMDRKKLKNAYSNARKGV